MRVSYLDDFGPNVRAILEGMDACGQAAKNKAQAEAKFQSDYPPPCDGWQGQQEGVEL